MDIEQLRFPIGKFEKPQAITAAIIEDCIIIIESFPAKIRAEVAHLPDEQLDTVYRPGGWTIRQLTHHCADSHMNALARFKWALTEDKPVIKPYLEASWAELDDSRTMAVDAALLMLDGLHRRWTVLLRSLSANDFKKSFIHPEHGRETRLEESLGIYAWHCRHHLAHITELKSRKGWK